MLYSQLCLAIFAALSFSVSASPTAAPEAGTAWPASLATRRSKTDTNAARIKRGLPPIAPSRLYDPSRVHSAPKARLSTNPAPPTADAFKFAGCTDAIAGLVLHKPPHILLLDAHVTDAYTDHGLFFRDTDAAAANACGNTLYQNTGNLAIRFEGYSFIEDNNAYRCVDGQERDEGNYVDCTQDNYAIYRDPNYQGVP